MQDTTTPVDWSSDDYSSDDVRASCVTGSTAIDALRLALGSTLGAFIALGVIVAFVLLAKCQHRRRVRRDRGRRHRLRRRRRRYSSDKSQPLTDSDNLSFFDYYDDELGSVFDDDDRRWHKDEIAATEFCRRSPPNSSPPLDRTQLIGCNDLIFADDGRTAAEIRAATSDQVPAQSFTATKSSADSSVVRPAIFVAGDIDDGLPVVVLPAAQNSPSDLRCFRYDVVDEELATRTDVLRPIQTAAPLPPHDNVMQSGSRDTTGLLSAADVERTLRPNHYSSLW